MKILVLDDHDGFREEVLGMLSRNHHEGVGVGNVDAAIPLAESGAFDFVLVDYSMPARDGIWFMNHVKLPRKTKALLVTGHVYREMIGACSHWGL